MMCSLLKTRVSSTQNGIHVKTFYWHRGSSYLKMELDIKLVRNNFKSEMLRNRDMLHVRKHMLVTA